MTEQLESELRAALRERAAQVPAASIARLTHVDYYPRTRRLRPPLAIGALASAAGAAGAAAIVISLSAGASNAFAGWSPRPTPAAPDQLAAASADCQTQSPIAGLPLKLADTRGPFTFSVYADSNSSATCIKGPTFTSVSNSTTSSPIDVPAGHILLSGSHASERGGSSYSFADGRTGDGVSAVTLVLTTAPTCRRRSRTGGSSPGGLASRTSSPPTSRRRPALRRRRSTSRTAVAVPAPRRRRAARRRAGAVPIAHPAARAVHQAAPAAAVGRSAPAAGRSAAAAGRSSPAAAGSPAALAAPPRARRACRPSSLSR